MAEKAREMDPPMVVAVIICKAPGAVVRVGIAYLRFKRRMRTNSRRFRESLVSNGMPEEKARALAMKYETDVSLMTLLRGLSKAARGRGAKPGSQAGN